jgi:hypothetical protein
MSDLMRRVRNLAPPLTAGFIVACGGGGGSGVTPPPPPAKSISVSCDPSVASVIQGQPYTVTATSTPKNGATVTDTYVRVNGTQIGSGGLTYTTPAIQTPSAGTQSITCGADSPDATVTPGNASVDVTAKIDSVNETIIYRNLFGKSMFANSQAPLPIAGVNGHLTNGVATVRLQKGKVYTYTPITDGLSLLYVSVKDSSTGKVLIGMSPSYALPGYSAQQDTATATKDITLYYDQPDVNDPDFNQSTIDAIFTPGFHTAGIGNVMFSSGTQINVNVAPDSAGISICDGPLTQPWVDGSESEVDTLQKRFPQYDFIRTVDNNPPTTTLYLNNGTTITGPVENSIDVCGSGTSNGNGKFYTANYNPSTSQNPAAFNQLTSGITTLVSSTPPAPWNLQIYIYGLYNDELAAEVEGQVLDINDPRTYYQGVNRPVNEIDDKAFDVKRRIVQNEVYQKQVDDKKLIPSLPWPATTKNP